jgi:uncharacterized RDD family membrane protein YckC
MSTLACPDCWLINPPGTGYCDCGYSFEGKKFDRKELLPVHAPGLGVRFLALILDGLIFLPLHFTGVLFKLDLSIYVLGAYILYIVFTLTFYGQTLGYRIVNIKLLTVDKKKISFPQVLARNSYVLISFIFELAGLSDLPISNDIASQKSISAFLVILYGLLQIAAFFSSDHRRWIEDYIAGTKMYYLKGLDLEQSQRFGAV